MSEPPLISCLQGPATPADVRALSDLLIDAVRSGAAVSFLDTLTQDAARAWWEKTIAGLPPRSVMLVARDASGEIVGTVQVQPAWAPNQPHRAEIVKLLVHGRARRAGLGAKLMEAAEKKARDGGFSLLTLDARAGGAAERLYLRQGWTLLGTIPRYAMDTDGVTPHDAVFFYKHLA